MSSAVDTSVVTREPGTALRPSADLRWRIIVDHQLPGSRNMALDHALASTLGPGEAVLRMYGWERPTVSFGRNEPTAGSYSIEDAIRRGIEYVRRPTGGRAVFHAHELTYAVVLPARALGGPRSTYRRINQALVEGIGQLGADVTIATRGKVLAPDAGPCFMTPTPGEVVADGGKLVGSAQARLKGALLQHGSLLIGGDQSVLHELSGSKAVSGLPTTLNQLVHDVSQPDVIAAVTAGFRGTLGGSWRDSAYEPGEIDEAERLEDEIYSRHAWTWRR